MAHLNQNNGGTLLTVYSTIEGCPFLPDMQQFNGGVLLLLTRGYLGKSIQSSAVHRFLILKDVQVRGVPHLFTQHSKAKDGQHGFHQSRSNSRWKRELAGLVGTTCKYNGFL